MVKRLWLFGRRQGRRDERDNNEVGYHKNLPAVSAVSALSALSKELISREAHHTFKFSVFTFQFIKLARSAPHF